MTAPRRRLPDPHPESDSEPGPNANPGSDSDEASPVERATWLELFFDLVFVLTITQLTSVLVGRLSWTSAWHVAVMLGLIFWMYDGYAWLTNAVPARGGRTQALLLGAMMGYLVLAIAIPRAFTGAGLTFALAYLVITCVHTALYVTSAAAGSAAAARSLAPGNLTAAVAVVVGGAVGGEFQVALWTVVALMLWLLTRTSRGFQIGSAHFVERHGQLVLIALGESVTATGVAARGLAVDATRLVAAVVGLGLSAQLWWTYFGAGDERSERALSAKVGADRVRAAFRGFGYAHYVMLLGIVLVAVGVRFAVAHPGTEMGFARALALSGGTSLFLAGHGGFESALGLSDPRRRTVGAVAVLLAVPVGLIASALLTLVTTVVLVATVVALEPSGLGDAISQTTEPG